MISINTVRVSDKANAMKQKIREYEVLINKLYSKINDVQSNKIWVGPSADRYTRRIMLDKVEMLNFSDALKKMCNELDEFSKKSEKVARMMEGGK